MRLDAESIRRATVDQIESALEARGAVGRQLMALLEQDPRAGVRRLAVRERTRRHRRRAERRRVLRLRQLEGRLWAAGLVRVAGVDEVGRGCLAGPVVAAAVVLPPAVEGLEELDDSKVLDADTRARLRDRLAAVALDLAVAAVDAAQIDRINILEASLEAMRLALAGLAAPPEHVLVDGARTPGSPFAETAVVDGDARSLSIAAASVVAKVHRDALMVAYDRQFPGYGFASNKGYASAEHRAALGRLGPCALHRRSFAPLARRDQLTLDLGGPPAALRPGERGEAAAADYLRRSGYRVLHRHYRAAGGEIDLVAQTGTCYVFAEVKTTQRGGGEPEGRIDRAKRRHLVRAARHFAERCAAPEGGGVEFRFDVIAVDLGSGGPRIDHTVDAFTADPE